jgi:translation initiation factor IF-2
VDLEEERKVGRDVAEELLKKIGAVYYIETSAKSNIGIEDVILYVMQLFQKAAEFMYKKYSTS